MAEGKWKVSFLRRRRRENDKLFLLKHNVYGKKSFSMDPPLVKEFEPRFETFELRENAKQKKKQKKVPNFGWHQTSIVLNDVLKKQKEYFDKLDTESLFSD